MGKLKNVILGIAIAIIFAFFIGFGIDAFYQQPDEEDFCEGISRTIGTDDCPVIISDRPVPVPEDSTCYCREDCRNGTCTDVCTKQNPEYTACMDEFDQAEEVYLRNLFIVASILGLAALIVGGFVLKHDTVSPGLMGGGLLTIVYGIIRYWEYAGSILRFIILGLMLALLIYVAYKRWPGRRSRFLFLLACSPLIM